MHAVEETHRKYPDHNVVVTGHSLGGAIASMAAGYLRERGHIVDLVSPYQSTTFEEIRNTDTNIGHIRRTTNR